VILCERLPPLADMLRLQGAGVFVTTGFVAVTLAGPAVILSYAAAGLSALLSSLCYAGALNTHPPLYVLSMCLRLHCLWCCFKTTTRMLSLCGCCLCGRCRWW
jgi:hypothetical protein